MSPDLTIVFELADQMIEHLEAADKEVKEYKRSIQRARKDLESVRATHVLVEASRTYHPPLAEMIKLCETNRGSEHHVATFTNHNAAYRHKAEWGKLGFASRSHYDNVANVYEIHAKKPKKPA